MSGLAKYCKNVGMIVSGSDVAESIYTRELENIGIRVFYTHKRRNVRGVEIVVYNAAINEDNPELCAARDNRKLLIKRSELLGMIIDKYSERICVAGCHGKTTVTAMLSHIFCEAGSNPTCFIGGRCLKEGNFTFGDSNIVIAEACEFKRNFLDIHPNYVVVTNIDNDHMDCYRDMEDLKEAYRLFSRNAVCYWNGSDSLSCSLQKVGDLSYGKSTEVDYRAENLSEKDACFSFDVIKRGCFLCRIELKILGEYNVMNALAAVAVADDLGISTERIVLALSLFSGIERRNEWLGRLFGIDCYADYAHHPHEIAASLITFHKLTKGRLVVVFQPHTYSRTRLLMMDFVEALREEENLIVYSTYPAREEYDAKGSAYLLKTQLPCALYADTPERLFSLLRKRTKDGDVVLFLGAGNLYDIVKKEIKNSRADKANS